MEAWLAFARGPAFVFAFSFMILGLVRHTLLTLLEISRVMRRAGDKEFAWKRIVRATARWLLPAGQLRRHPAYSMTSILFHAAIIVVPLFLAGHIALWDKGLGISWPAIPNGLADVLTVVAVAAAAALVVQRAAARATRALSGFQEYALPPVVALPFISGFLVMHPQWSPVSHESMLLVHVLSADLLMVLMPLTKLTHAVLIPGVQLVAELGWHWPPDAGGKLARTLGKEGVPI